MRHNCTITIMHVTFRRCGRSRPYSSLCHQHTNLYADKKHLAHSMGDMGQNMVLEITGFVRVFIVSYDESLFGYSRIVTVACVCGKDESSWMLFVSWKFVFCIRLLSLRVNDSYAHCDVNGRLQRKCTSMRFTRKQFYHNQV